MSDYNLVKTPMEIWLKLLKDGKREEVNPSLFRSLIGSLRYLVYTQPDITYNMSYLSRFMHKQTFENMNAGTRVVQYIKETSAFGLRYKKRKKVLYDSRVD